MRIQGKALLSFCVGSLLLSGCVAVPQDGRFDEISADVQGRTGFRVDWYRDGEASAQARAEIDRILTEPLTAERAVQLALLNNRGLQATFMDLGIAQADLVQAGLISNPLFDAVIRFPGGGESPNLDLGLAFEVLDILYVPLRKSVATSEFESARIRVTGEVLDLMLETRTAFYGTLASKQTTEMLGQVLAATNASYELASRLHAAGNITALALDIERSLVEQAKLDLADSESGMQSAREQLNELLGLWGPATAWEMDGRLAPVPDVELELDLIEKRAIEQSLDLALARQSLTTLGRKLRLTNVSALIPDIEAGMEMEREDGDWQLGPSLALPIPIFDQGQARKAVARATVRQSQENYAALAISIRARARDARQRLIHLRQKAIHFRDVVLPLRQRILAQTQLEYNAMQIGTFQLLFAKQQQIAAGRQFIDALREYWVARATLEQLMNGRLPSGTGASVMGSPSSSTVAAQGDH